MHRQLLEEQWVLNTTDSTSMLITSRPRPFSLSRSPIFSADNSAVCYKIKISRFFNNSIAIWEYRYTLCRQILFHTQYTHLKNFKYSPRIDRRCCIRESIQWKSGKQHSQESIYHKLWYNINIYSNRSINVSFLHWILLYAVSL